MNIINSVHKYKAANRSWYQRNVNTIEKIVVHHTASRQVAGTDDAILRAEANHHINTNGWPGLSYTFVILPNGNVHQINNFSDVTWTDGINWDCIAICLQGYFHPTVNEKPTAAQLKSLRELLNELSTNHPEFPADKADVFGHKDRAQTACPGDLLYPYVKEYREKLGEVTWGGAPVPVPPPSSETFLGKPKAYWLQVEQDRLNLLAKVGNLETTINNLNLQLSNVETELKNKILGYAEEFKNKVSSA